MILPPNKPIFVLNVSVFVFFDETSDIEKFKERSHTFVTSSGWGEGRRGWVQVKLKNGQNSDEGEWLQEGGRWEGIHRNWISSAIINISVIRVQAVYQTYIWSCYQCSWLASASAISISTKCLVQLETACSI